MMRKIVLALCLILLVAAVSVVYADQVKVNIVYPINGSIVPLTDPPPVGIKSAYFTISFGATCAGGPYKAEWGFDGAAPIGRATYYDQISVQQVWKLPAGPHIFWVKTSCGENRVKFQIGK